MGDWFADDSLPERLRTLLAAATPRLPFPARVLVSVQAACRALAQLASAACQVRGELDEQFRDPCFAVGWEALAAHIRKVSKPAQVSSSAVLLAYL